MQLSLMLTFLLMYYCCTTTFNVYIYTVKVKISVQQSVHSFLPSVFMARSLPEGLMVGYIVKCCSD